MGVKSKRYLRVAGVPLRASPFLSVNPRPGLPAGFIGRIDLLGWAGKFDA
jgi:hypothetical protein